MEHRLSENIVIENRTIGPGNPCYLIAELSANHRQNFDTAVAMIEAAHEAGADAVKLQTYTPDTITIDSNSASFVHGRKSLWAGKNLYQLYQDAYTPWDWQPQLKACADEIGIPLFSTPFDHSAVDFLEEMDVPAYKIASFEIVDIPLIKKVAATGKPLIFSTGMARLDEVEMAVQAAIEAGAKMLSLLKCCSAYPAVDKDMNLRTITDLKKRFKVPIGLSDHTLGGESAVAAVALGASVIEKHFTLDRSAPSPDSAFSLEPHEFRILCDSVRAVECALGTVSYGATDAEQESLKFRRSLFVVKNIEEGELLTGDNIRSIRPANGLPPCEWEQVIGRRARVFLERGEPLRKEDLV